MPAGAEVDKANRRGTTPLTAAVFNGNERLVRLLLEAGAEPGVIDATGKGAMVSVAGRGFAGIVETLLEAGIEVNSR